MTAKRTTKSYVDGFKLVSEVGVNPEWPNHTGVRTWKSGIWKAEVHNMGGIRARQKIMLFRHSEMVGYHSDIMKIPSLRRWITKHIDKFQKK